MPTPGPLPDPFEYAAAAVGELILQHMFDHDTAVKIASHKFRNRKLTSVGYLQRVNGRMSDSKDNGGVIHTQLGGDATLQGIIQQMNTYAAQFFQALDLTIPDNLANPVKFSAALPFFPKSVWLGYIDFPIGYEANGQSKQSAENAEEAFADAAGLLRKRVALLLEMYGVLNDLANSPNKPNRGGQALGDKAAHQAAE